MLVVRARELSSEEEYRYVGSGWVVSPRYSALRFAERSSGPEGDEGDSGRCVLLPDDLDLDWSLGFGTSDSDSNSGCSKL